MGNGMYINITSYDYYMFISTYQFDKNNIGKHVNNKSMQYYNWVMELIKKKQYTLYNCQNSYLIT